jgi:NADH-quinone oxidoreductase subunit G
MATIFIDNQPYTVKDGQNLLQACLSLGFNLPYFCWHPALGSVGACRQCAVKQFRDEKDTRGRLVMACMTPAAEGTRISIFDPDAVAFRANVIEWLMENHPHDCPVCDEGGECHLQDMTVMTGHVYRRYRFPKRTYRNQYLGPFINHEMNRCIQCYRCVRFYNDYAGGRDFGVFAVHDHVYFGRHDPGVLQSEFSGNLVEVCPTGVFTDKTLKRHYTRKWDFQTAPSICVQCSLGCNIEPGERYGELRRIRNRYNGDVNGYFICDRGRYGYEFVNHPSRIRQVIDRTTSVPVARPTAMPAPDPNAFMARLGQMAREPWRTIGIGSPRASLEANFALRTLVGPERFFTGMSEEEDRLVSAILDILQTGPAPTASLQEVRECDTIFVLGEDVTNTAPVLALALRQAARNIPMQAALKARIPRWDDAPARELLQGRTGPFAVASVDATKLDEIASLVYRGAPDDLARLGQAVAAAIDNAVEPPTDLSDDVQALAATIAQALKSGSKPLVVSGTSHGSLEIVQAAANIAWALNATGLPARLVYAAPAVNSIGVGMLGQEGPAPAGGRSLEAAVHAVQQSRPDMLVILENDLSTRLEDAKLRELYAAAKHVVVLDHNANPTTDHAEVVLPAGTFAESDGTLVNNEGRAQRFYQVFPSQGEEQESWRWLRDMMNAANRPEAQGWTNLDDVSEALAKAMPIFQPITEIAPPADFRIAGQRIARQHARATGRTAIYADVTVFEPPPPVDPDAPFSFSMEGFQGEPPSALIPRFWAPGWNSIQSLNKFQDEVAGPLRGGNPGKRVIGTPSPHGSNVGGDSAPSGSTAMGQATAQKSASTGAPAPAAGPAEGAALAGKESAATGKGEAEGADRRGEAKDRPGGPEATGTPSAGEEKENKPEAEPKQPALQPHYFTEMPPAFNPRTGERQPHWLIVGLPHIFGSDELSVLSPGIAELAPKPYVALNPDDAARLDWQEGREVELSLGGQPRRVLVHLRPEFPQGVAGIPTNLPGLRGIALPMWSRLP